MAQELTRKTDKAFCSVFPVCSCSLFVCDGEPPSTETLEFISRLNVGQFENSGAMDAPAGVREVFKFWSAGIMRSMMSILAHQQACIP